MRPAGFAISSLSRMGGWSRGEGELKEVHEGRGRLLSVRLSASLQVLDGG